MLADIQLYILGLADNLAAFMTGGILVAIVAIWERFRERSIPLKFYLMLFLGVGFMAASFQTWRQEYAAKTLAQQMAFKGRNPDTVRRLQDYYADAATFYIQATEAKSDAEFKKMEKSADEWMSGL